jgi:hypothetical protein
LQNASKFGLPCCYKAVIDWTLWPKDGGKLSLDPNDTRSIIYRKTKS